MNAFFDEIKNSQKLIGSKHRYLMMEQKQNLQKTQSH